MIGKGMLIGAGAGLVLTLVLLSPFWVAPGSPFWQRMGNWPEPAQQAITFVIRPLAAPGMAIAQSIHHHRCEPLGCRAIHLGWMLGWSLALNTTIGGLIGGLAAAMKRRLGRTTRWWVFSLRSKPTV